MDTFFNKLMLLIFWVIAFLVWKYSHALALLILATGYVIYLHDKNLENKKEDYNYYEEEAGFKYYKDNRKYIDNSYDDNSRSKKESKSFDKGLLK